MVKRTPLRTTSVSISQAAPRVITEVAKQEHAEQRRDERAEHNRPSHVVGHREELQKPEARECSFQMTPDPCFP